jgi:GDP-L-fucose synthase
MTVLVTGGEGFLGSHLVARLRADGIEPVIARRSEHDLTNAADVERLFSAARPQVVFHLAADVGGIGANQANPARYWYANLLMGAHVLEQSYLTGVEKLIVVGTVCSYPKLTPVPFREADLWNGFPEETNAPYGIAKKALLVGSQAYRAQHGLNAVFVLPANLYGPGDDFDPETSHVIPALIRKMSEARDAGHDEVVLWGDGSPTREFLYVEDCAEALVLVAEGYDDDEPLNVGTGQETSIAETARLVAAATGFRGKIVWNPSRPGGQPRRRLDVSRAEQLLGFRARTSLVEGLRRTIDWYSGTRIDAGSTRAPAALREPV